MSYLVENDAALMNGATETGIARRLKEEKIMGPDSLPCPKCGFNNPPDAENCEGCGERIILEPDDRSSVSGSATHSEPPTAAFVCPKCGHPTDLATADCLKCGIIFAKWYESIEDLSAEETEQLARLREIQAQRELAAEAERQRIETERKAELERQREVLKRRMAQAEAQRRAKEAARLRAEAEASQREEAIQRREAEARQRTEAAERLKAEAQAMEAERRRAEAQAHQQAMEAERRRTEEEARQRLEAAERLKAEEEARQKAEQADQLRAEEEARQKVEAAKQEKTFSMPQILKALRPKGRLSDLLRKYENLSVGLQRGPDGPVETMTLLRALEDYIVLHAEDSTRVIHIPLRRIDHLEENLDGQNGGSEVNETLAIVLVGPA